MEFRVRGKDLFLLGLIALLWGVTFFFVKVAVQSFAPCTVVAGRLFFASLFLLGYMLVTGKKMPKPGRPWVPFLILGLTNCTLPYLLIAWGEVYIDSGLAAILGATMPLFTIILGLIFTGKEMMSWSKGIGIIVGLIGVALLIGPEAIKGLGVHVWAQLANVIAAAFYAGAAVYGSSIKGFHPLVVSFGQIFMALLTIFPFMLAEAPWSIQPSTDSLLALVGLGLVSTAIPYVIYFYLLTTIGPTNTSLVTYLIPPVGVITGVMFLDEQVTLLSVAALILILAGVAGVSGIKMEKRIEIKEPLSGS